MKLFLSALERRFLVFILLILFATACAPSRQLSQQNVERELLNQFQRWQGTPYRLGGMSTTGVDCSAFILLVYRDAFNVELPRNTGEQLRAGKPVSRRKLQIGDLVFFRTGNNVMHVGIVLSNGRMMHASTSNGVEITQLNQEYWIRRFIGARRVL